MAEAGRVDLDTVRLGGEGEVAALEPERLLALAFHIERASVGAAAGLQLDHPAGGFARQRGLPRQPFVRHTLRLERFEVEPLEDRGRIGRQTGRVVLAEPLERLVDRRAADADVDPLVRPGQLVEAQNVTRPDHVGVSGQRLDPGDRQRAGAILDRRPGVRSRDELVLGGLRRIEGAGPVDDVAAPRDLHAGAGGQGLQTPQPARLHGRGAVAPLRVQQDHVGGAGGLGEVVGRKADAPFGRGQAEGLAHGPRQERVQRRPGRPDVLLQSTQDQPVGADQPGLHGAQDAQPRVGRASCAHGLGDHQAVQEVGEAARRGRG